MVCVTRTRSVYSSRARASLLLALMLVACVEAFVPIVDTRTISIVNRGTFSTLSVKNNGGEEEGRFFMNKNDESPDDVGRRGTLLTLLSTAASFALGDVVLNTAVKVTTGGSVSSALLLSTGTSRRLYERVLSFGRARGGPAIASEELTTWIASQSRVAATPEITAWLAAQKKLQMLRKGSSALAATATEAMSRVKRTQQTTTAAAAVAGGSVLEEGMLTAAATAAVKALTTREDSTPNKNDVENAATSKMNLNETGLNQNERDTDEGEENAEIQ